MIEVVIQSYLQLSTIALFVKYFCLGVSVLHRPVFYFLNKNIGYQSQSIC